MLSPHEEIVVGVRIADPDEAFARLIERATDPDLRARIEAAKALPAEDRQAWLLAGSAPVEHVHRMEPATGCAAVVVIVVVTVIVGYVVGSGESEAITEEREMEREVQQCIDENNNRFARARARAAEQPVMLTPSEQIALARCVRDVPATLERLLGETADPELRARIERVRALTAAEQQQWLLDRSRRVERVGGRVLLPAPPGCVVLIIAVAVTVVVGWRIVNGIREAITEEREEEREVMECREDADRARARHAE